jgi:hypothetical protein
MEKYVIFGPMIIFMGFFGLLILGFFYLVVKLIRRGLKDYWTGTILNKLYNERKDKEIGENIGHSDRFYTLLIKTDSGQERKIAVSSKFYNECNVGDRLEKKKGKAWPEKI